MGKNMYYWPMISTISTVFSDGIGLFKSSCEKKITSYPKKNQML